MVDYLARSKRHNQILSGIEAKYQRSFGNTPLLKAVELAVGSPIISQAYKKIMCIKEFYSFESIPLKSSMDKLKSIGLAGVYPIWILAQIGFPTLHKKQCTKYKLGVMVGCASWSLNNKYRTVDFLLEGVDLNKENTLFCIEEPISQSYKDVLTSKGYTQIELRKLLKNAEMGFIYTNIIKKQLSAWLSLLLKSPFIPAHITRLTLEILYKSALWEMFLQKYSLDHYVSYNEYLPADVVRYIYFNRAGIETWCYQYSNSTDDFITPPGEDDILNPHYSYWAYHHLVVWGKKMEKYYCKHPGQIQHFDSLGCLWSEHVRISKEYPSQNSVLTGAKQKFLGLGVEKIIGVFDTSFTDLDTSFTEACPITYKDMISFVDGLLQLLNTHPTIGIIFKNKFTKNYLQKHVSQIVPIYQQLKEHPRCYFPYGEDNVYGDPTECVAASDLVISAPFTSSCIEALGAGTKAIYYDATNKFPGCYYDRIPKFVAHNYGALKDYVVYWLYKNTPEEFEMFLHNYVEGELEEHIDGKAITRFREKLLGV